MSSGAKTCVRIGPRSARITRTAVRTERVRALRERGMSLRQIAADIGVSAVTIHLLLSLII